MLEVDLRPGRIAAAALAVLGPASAFAHHAVPQTFDMEMLTELSGSISRVELVNPHVVIELTTTDESGADAIWVVEMGAPNALIRRGFDPRELLVTGRRVTIEAWPAKDGTNSASANRLVTADGTAFNVVDGFGLSAVRIQAGNASIRSQEPGDPVR